MDPSTLESPTQVLFLPAMTLGQSQRQKELHRSMALSHAAHVTHCRRRFEATTNLSFKKQRAGNQSLILKRPSAPQESGIVEEALPSPVIYCGNSDPFSSTTFPLTPRAGQLLDFACTFMIPQLFNARPCGPSSESRLSRLSLFAHSYGGTKYGVFLDVDFAKSIPSMMQDECRGLSFLLINMAALRNLSPPGTLEQEHSALQCKTLSTLRKRVSQGQGDPTSVDNIIFGISSLFAAAVFAHDLVEATLHGGVVYEQFRRHANLINPHQIIRTVYSDIMLASTYMVPTIFDVAPGGWVCEQMAPHFALLDLDLSARRALLDLVALPSRAVGSSLEEVLISTRVAHWIWCMPPPLSPPSLYNHWVLTQHLLLQGRCVNLLVQLRDQSGVSWEEEDECGPGRVQFYLRTEHGKTGAEIDAWIQATVATALTVLFTLFRAGEGAEQRFWRGARSFLKQLRILLARTLQIVATNQGSGGCPRGERQERFRQHTQRDLHAPLVWAAFVGLLAEIRGTVKKEQEEVLAVNEAYGRVDRDGYFLYTLRAEIAVLDLTDWTGLQLLLESLVYPEGFVPDCLANLAFPNGCPRKSWH